MMGSSALPRVVNPPAAAGAIDANELVLLPVVRVRDVLLISLVLVKEAVLLSIVPETDMYEVRVVVLVDVLEVVVSLPDVALDPELVVTMAVLITLARVTAQVLVLLDE